MATSCVPVPFPVPFFVDELRRGERLRTYGGVVKVMAVDRHPGLWPVFNLEIGEVHQYYVSEAEVLAHNAKECLTGASVNGTPVVGYGANAGEAAVENAAGAEIRIALRIEDHLDDFARTNGAQSWKQFAAKGPLNWKSAFLEQMNNPNSKVLFNLKDVDVWGGVLRASSGFGGATDWELLQIQQNPQWWKQITWLIDGVARQNPFI